MSVIYCLALVAAVRSQSTTQPSTEPDSNNQTLIILAALAIIWIIFVTFFFSRLLAFIITRLLQWKVFKRSDSVYFSIGSVSISVISGVVAFRDLRYITKDWGLTVFDGYFQIRFV